MLILNRKQGESLIIDDKIEIKILEVSEGKIKIGIEAPKSVKVFRKEVYEEIREENKKASTISLDSFSKLQGPLK
ncbi:MULTISPECIES: carbon storage regulator CsrA [Proteiniclasticum]|jgi:carbon storage regulator|uniref:Translational regulator CsrA n=1 Tax=Proteiniclasticum ruminis TaxID=398199 RepID=A0A1I5CB25_9CLOT|nr:MULTISPECIES: carbon storage regulator CsrA [Proteiniclasticum]SDI12496.1 carbon storage regulator [Proteiniclasticum ruminis]SFN83992.1 carbon storage regulator, CsrA [Proteiniclasticum ruminis]HBW13683.1 carbon storage regulator [Proteiniclasticum sp.]